jgi:hypothetical protein
LNKGEFVSAYRLAIVQTITTIDTRARYFRDFVVADVVLTFGSMGWAAVTWTFWSSKMTQ